MRKHYISRVVSVLCLLAVMSVPADAQVPQTINYQGVLMEKIGGVEYPVDGEVTMTFAIYDQAENGTSLWEETLTIDVENGKYSVILGKTDGNPIDLTDTGAIPYWLGITVGTDAEMEPRVEMTSVMYSLFPEDQPGVAEWRDGRRFANACGTGDHEVADNADQSCECDERRGAKVHRLPAFAEPNK